MQFVVSTRARLAVISRSRIRRLALVEGEAGVEVLGVWSGRVVLGGWGWGLRGGLYDLREMSYGRL